MAGDVSRGFSWGCGIAAGVTFFLVGLPLLLMIGFGGLVCVTNEAAYERSTERERRSSTTTERRHKRTETPRSGAGPEPAPPVMLDPDAPSRPAGEDLFQHQHHRAHGQDGADDNPEQHPVPQR